MAIILNSSKRLINVEIYFILEKKLHGNIIFNFIRSKEELDKYIKQGYKIENNIIEYTSSEEPESTPGSPVKNDKIIYRMITTWSTLTWKENNFIVSKSLRPVTQPDSKISYELDYIRYRDMQLKTCLKRWNLMDEGGQNIPVNEELIDGLDPALAQELHTSFQKVTEPSEKDLKE